MRLACMFLLLPLLSLAQQNPVSPKHLNPSTAQHPPSVNYHQSSSIPAHPLTIGDTLPASGLNYKPQTTKHKLTIINFFATWCPVCVSEFPKLDSLQKAFAGQVSFILLTYEPPLVLKALQAKSKRFAALNIPVITGDTVLSKFFPHRYLPHTVWLSSSGRVLAITGREELTASNIRSFLNGNTPTLAVKTDLVDFDSKAPLLSQPILQNTLQFQSVLTGSLQGASGALTNIRDSVGQTQRLTCINYSLLSLLELALGRPFSNRWQLGVKDSLRSLSGKAFSFYNSLWCYERILPSSMSKEAARLWMLEDLSRSFGISATAQKQTASCYALVKTGADSLLKSGGATPASTLLSKDSAVKYLRNSSITRLVKAFNFSTPPDTVPIVLDETGITYNIDIAFNIPNIQNLSALNELLPSYGLKLIPVQREIEFLVIKENSQKTP